MEVQLFIPKKLNNHFNGFSRNFSVFGILRAFQIIISIKVIPVGNSVKKVKFSLQAVFFNFKP